MPDSNRPRKNRFRVSRILLFMLATLLLAGFGIALAARSAVLPLLYFPLVNRDTGHKATATPTRTAIHTTAPTQTQARTPTAIVGAGKVTIVDFAFQPAEITVHVGETVEWENKGLVTHTTTSDTNLWDSSPLAPNQKFTFQFTSVGDYPYHCSIHLSMTGIIHVVPNP